MPLERNANEQAAQKIHDILSPAFEQTYTVGLLWEKQFPWSKMNLQTKKSKAEKKEGEEKLFKKWNLIGKGRRWSGKYIIIYNIFY